MKAITMCFKKYNGTQKHDLLLFYSSLKANQQEDKITEPSGEHHKNSDHFPLRLQNGCLPDQVPLGKHILSAEPYSVCPTAQVKRTLLRTLKFPASRLA